MFRETTDTSACPETAFDDAAWHPTEHPTARRARSSRFRLPKTRGTPLDFLRGIPTAGGPDYDAAIDQQRASNMDDARKSVRGKASEEKIRAYLGRHAIRVSYQEVMADLDRCPALLDFVAAAIVKEPGRQSLHQTVAANYLRALPHVEDFRNLLPGTAKAQIVHNGVVKFARELPRKKRAQLRSLDFAFVLPLPDGRKIDVYVSHKYTGADGGAQNHQRDDLAHQMEHAAKSRATDTLFLIVADGDYYLKNRGRGRTYLRTLNGYSNNFNAFALTSGQVGPFLDAYRAWRARFDDTTI